MHGWTRYVVAIAIAVGGLAGPRADYRPIRFDRVSIEQGLSQSSVWCIFQDSRGFIWMGTEDGLNRYDGYDFRIYKHDPEDPSSLGHDVVWAIDEDADGDLWIGTAGGGVARWERDEERFVRVASEPDAANALSSPHVRSLHVGEDGTVWIGTRDAGLNRLEPVSGEVTVYRHDPLDPTSLADDHVYAILTDRAGELWVGTDAGLSRFDAATGRFRSLRPDSSDPASLSDGRVRSIFEDGSGTLWVGTYGGGLNRLDRERRSFRQYRHDDELPDSLSHDRVRAVLEDDAGRLWVGTSGGLDLLDASRDRFVHYGNDPANPSSLADDHVISLFQDRGGVLWVGTRTAGVNRWNPLTWQFGHRAADPSNPDGLNNSNVMSFSEDRAGRLWIGTFGGGLNVMDRAGNMIHFQHEPDDPRSLSSNRVTAMVHDRQGLLWVGTLDGGLNRIDPFSGELRRFRHDPRREGSLAADGIMSLYEDSRGFLWVGTFGGGLDRFNRATGEFEHHRHDPGNPKSVGGDRVTSLVEDTRGRLWIGTDGGGLSRWDPKNGRFDRFVNDPETPGSLAAATVFALHVDSAGTLWVGTRGAGLDRLNDAAEAGRDVEFEHYSERDGLPNEVIYGILNDADGQIWVSTNDGLARFDPRTETFKTYDANDGLQSNEFHFGAAYRGANGGLYFGGVNGFNSFFPDRLRHNPHAPPVVLTAFLKFNEPVVELGPAAGIHSIDLGYRDDVVTFEFAALDYTSPGCNRYMYKLDGFDENWTDIGNIHRVTYTNLDPGNYVFQVRAANPDGVWNEEGLSIALDVQPPPWRTVWAYLAYTLLLGGAVLSFVRVQRLKLEREAAYSRRLEQDVKARTAEIAERNEELVELNSKLSQASVTDSLTGLANRRFLLEYLDKEVNLIHRRYARVAAGVISEESFDLVFMMVDLDNFKTINDTCGHAAGDKVLKDLRGILEGACRSSDILIRWGGDEFLIVGRDSDSTRLEALAERVRTRIEQHLFELDDGQIVRTTCTIGFACYPFKRSELDVLTWEQVVSVADRALYVAKRSGRNAWVGLLSTDKTPIKGLLGNVRNDPLAMIERGTLDVRSSIAAFDELVWDSPEVEPGTVTIAPANIDREPAPVD